jgi:hypothetical protein
VIGTWVVLGLAAWLARRVAGLVARRLLVLGLGVVAVTGGLAAHLPGATAQGQSVCGMLAAPGASFGSAVSATAAANGLNPQQAGAYTVIAVATHCPAVLAPLMTQRLLG